MRAIWRIITAIIPAGIIIAKANAMRAGIFSSIIKKEISITGRMILMTGLTD